MCVYVRERNKFCLFVCLGFLTSSSTTRLYRGRAPRQERLTILRAATHETELGDHDFCLSRSHERKKEGDKRTDSLRDRKLTDKCTAIPCRPH